MPFSTDLAKAVFLQKYSKDGTETWSDTCRRVVNDVCRDLTGTEREAIYEVMLSRKFIPGGRYLYAAGREWRNFNNCFLLRAEDSSEGWSDLMGKSTAMLMSGGGIGVDYSALRPKGAAIKRKGGESTGPLAAMRMVNEIGRYIMQGGNRRSAIFASLNWDHADVQTFLRMKDYPDHIKALKAADFTFPVDMELTNISVGYDTSFFDGPTIPDYEQDENAYREKIWFDNCRQAFKTAEPGMSFNYGRDRESLRNACCEVVSEDDSDKCNLGTVWMNRCDSMEDFHAVVRLATLFLVCGGVHSDVPTAKVREVGSANNRIGLGLGGMHEWLLTRGMAYEVTEELHAWLYWYVLGSEEMASLSAKRLGVSVPKGIRAIAPTGSIGILAETTTGIEPLFCKAYKRRYVSADNTWRYQYVVDGAVSSLLAKGVKVEAIQDSYDLSFEQRIAFQADVQQYVDMAISSTCNMAPWGTETNNESNVQEKADILYRYAKRLRGFTCYPDGSRSGQPLERCSIDEALRHVGNVYTEHANICDISGKGGACGS